MLHTYITHKMTWIKTTSANLHSSSLGCKSDKALVEKKDVELVKKYFEMHTVQVFHYSNPVTGLLECPEGGSSCLQCCLQRVSHSELHFSLRFLCCHSEVFPHTSS